MTIAKAYKTQFSSGPYRGRVRQVGCRRFDAPICARGTLHCHAAYLLMCDLSIIDIFSLVECHWDHPATGARLLPFELYFANSEPVLLDVVTDTEATSPDVVWQHCCIRANLRAYGCSDLLVWEESKLEPIAIANARALIDESEPASADEEHIIVAALQRLGGSAHLDALKVASGLNPFAYGPILDLIARGVLRLANRRALIGPDSIVLRGSP